MLFHHELPAYLRGVFGHPPIVLSAMKAPRSVSDCGNLVVASRSRRGDKEVGHLSPLMS